MLFYGVFGNIELSGYFLIAQTIDSAKKKYFLLLLG